MTGRELISAQLRLIGALASGETLEASAASDGLAANNRMLDSWSIEGLTVYAVTPETPLTLTPGDGTVTLGTSGDITTRPVKIEKALIRDGSTDYSPMRMLTVSEYAAIPDKSLQSNFPYSLFDDGGYPQRTLYLYPVPSSAVSLVLYTMRALSQIATLDTVLSLPPGYERALVYNGAIELAPEYGKAVSAQVAKIASESKDNLKRANYRPNLLRCDEAPSARRGVFDILIGGYR